MMRWACRPLRTDADGRAHRQQYDADERLTTVVWYNSSGTATQTFTYSYDKVGNELTATNARARTR